jgi:glycosyltransferase involved in cell wall biosynthesis
LKISAIIPTYNRNSHVLRAIDSVLAQTVPANEIIVVDDGSTDGTADATARRYGSRVAVIRQENAGASAARNHGVREARGEWIAFLDSDDVWHPTKLERQVAAISTLGDQFGACFTDCEYVGDSSLRRSAFTAAGLEGRSEFSQLVDPRFYLLGGPPVMYTQSMLFLRSLAEELNGFDEAMAVSEDLDLLFRLTFKTKICLVSRPLVRIDRTPFRPLALTELYTRRDDRKYDMHKWVYTKWLALPEVAGTEYEPRVRDLLRGICYDSAEAKIHELRMGPALRELGLLRSLGASYPTIIATLFRRKLWKIRHNIAKRARSDAREAIQ